MAKVYIKDKDSVVNVYSSAGSTPGVVPDYIKISKINDNGEDLTATLESLTTITIPFSNGNSSVFLVSGITDSGNYFTYTVNPPSKEPDLNDSASLDYSFTGSLNTGVALGPASAYAIFPMPYNSNPISIAASSKDTANFYDERNEKYLLNTLPQKTLNIRAKVIFSPTQTVFTTNWFGIYIIPPGVTDLLPNPVATVFNGIDGANPYLYKLSTNVGQGAPNPSTLEFDVDVPVGKIPPGSSIEVRIIGGAMDAAVTILAGSEIYISSTTATGQAIGTVPEPYFTSRFEGSDCDVTINNVSKTTSNPFLQDIDYSTNPSTPVNIDLIISGTAARGEVPESYYTSHAQISSRYLGSKNQSSGVNIYKENAGNTVFGGPINVGTFGNVSPITQEQINIFEYEWGSSTYPMILDYGQLKMSNILQASSKDQVKIVQKTSNAIKKPYPDGRFITTSQPVIQGFRETNSTLDLPFVTGSVITTYGTVNVSTRTHYYYVLQQSRGEFYQILNGSNKENSQIQLGNYSANSIADPIMPNTSKILATGWATPEKPNFMFTSSYTGGLTMQDNVAPENLVEILSGSYAFILKGRGDLIWWGGFTYPNADNGYINSPISSTKLNAVGAVQVGGVVGGGNNTGTGRPEIFPNTLNSGLNLSERAYVTLYRELESPGPSQSLEDALTDGSTTIRKKRGTKLKPWNYGYNELNEDGNYDFPLAAQGVYEILGNGFSDYQKNAKVTIMTIHPPVKFDDSIVSGSAYIQNFPTYPSGAFNVNNGNLGGSFFVTGSVEGRPGPEVILEIDLLNETEILTSPSGNRVSLDSQKGDFEYGDVIVIATSEFGGTGGTPIKFALFGAAVHDNKVKVMNIGTSISSYGNQYKDSPTNSLGAFVWLAVGNEQVTGEEYVVIQDELKGVGPGYFADKFTPKEITDNIESITKEFGSNKT